MTTATQIFVDKAYVARCEGMSDVLMSYLPMERIHSVVDLGCGSGLVGKAFEALGREVTYVDGREENLAPLRAEGRRVIRRDAHSFVGLGSDLVLCLGLLYHSDEPQRILTTCAEIAPIIALETLCLDLNGVWCLTLEEETLRNDQSVDGGACRPSPDWLHRALRKAGYDNIHDLSEMVPSVEPSAAHQGFVYRWKVEGSGDSYRRGYGLRKLMVAHKGTSE